MVFSSAALTKRGSDALDGLRALAAALVVLHHVRIWLFARPGDVTSWSPAARLFYRVTAVGSGYVLVFFVLSGFFVGGAVGRRMSVDQFSWREYAVDRGTRLYIVLVPALVFTAVVDAIGRALTASHSVYDGVAPYALHPFEVASTHVHVTTFLGNLAFLQDRIVPTFGSNAPLWTLGLEFWFYLAFPAALALFWAARTGRARLLVGIALVVSLARLHADLTLFVIWLFGAAVAFLPTSWVRVRIAHRAVRLVAGACLLLLAVALSGLFDGFGRRTSELAIGAAAAALVLTLSHGYSKADLQRRAASGPLMSHLAKSSYTLYLFHAPLIVLYSATTIHQAGQLWQPSAGRLVIAVGITLALVGLADAISFLTERRTPELRTALRRSLPVS